jgi:tetratricopeptide (TPR) repeat protein
MKTRFLLVFALLISIYVPLVGAAPDKQFVELMRAGVKMHDNGRYAESIDLYKKALDVDNNAWAWYEIGYSYLKMGDDDNASRAFDKAVEIDPTYFKAYVQLGYLFSKHDRPDIGNALYFKAYLIEPKGAVGSLNNIAINLRQQGINKAVDFYRLVLARYPDNKLLLFNLSQIYSDRDFEYLTDEEINKRNILKTALVDLDKLRNRPTAFYDKELDYYIALIHLVSGDRKRGKEHTDICAKSSNEKVKSKCEKMAKNGYRLQSTIEQRLFIEGIKKLLSIR